MLDNVSYCMCRAFSSAAWCYQKIDPPMEHFKAKAMPRLQLITCKIASLFKKRHCWTTHDWKWGCCRDTTERTTVHWQKQGWKLITNETISEREVGLYGLYRNTKVGHRSQAFDEIFSCFGQSRHNKTYIYTFTLAAGYDLNIVL